MNSAIHSLPAAPHAAPVACGSTAGLQPGTHLVTPRFGYEHHGIYVGDGRVVHYAGLSRLLLLRGPVEEVSLQVFADGRAVSIKSRPLPRFAPAEIVTRARSRLGENRYRLTTNNCEHFCEWCLSGESRSEQVERAIGFLRQALTLAALRVRALLAAGLQAA
jgi:Lecithin retinol acyltransferase